MPINAAFNVNGPFQGGFAVMDHAET